ncbi:hypothetical protein EGW03_04745 [bacterium]|nr:hypothetical protein [bacterium]
MTTNYGTSYALKLNTTGTVSPGLGGFIQWTIPDLNKTYIHTFIANIPEGSTLNISHNYLGENYEQYWLSNNIGTGNWYQYSYVIKTGTNLDSNHNSLGSFGHIYIENILPSLPFTWYISYSQMYEINNNGNKLYWIQFKDNIKLDAYQITKTATTPTNNWKAFSDEYYLTYIPESNEIYYIWVKDISGNVDYYQLIQHDNAD